jgi:hypothetical protein
MQYSEYHAVFLGHDVCTRINAQHITIFTQVFDRLPVYTVVIVYPSVQRNAVLYTHGGSHPA